MNNIVGSPKSSFVFNEIVGCTFIFDFSFPFLGLSRYVVNAEVAARSLPALWLPGNQPAAGPLSPTPESPLIDK